jgi:hypothetical protein
MDIHDILANSSKFMLGIQMLYDKKPTDLILLKACEELSDVQMHILFVGKVF